MTGRGPIKPSREIAVATSIGPHFLRAADRIGRERLPPGIVAILNDLPHLHLAIQEMHDFVARGEILDAGRAGVVFDVVTAGERESLNWSVQRVKEDSRATCGNVEGFRHLLDVNQIRHIHNRHCNANVESRHGQIALAVPDFYRIPEVVHPRNLTDCVEVGGATRLAFERRYKDGNLVVIEEVRRAKRELVVITLYKHK